MPELYANGGLYGNIFLPLNQGEKGQNVTTKVKAGNTAIRWKENVVITETLKDFINRITKILYIL